jgi:hypothetical protein
VLPLHFVFVTKFKDYALQRLADPVGNIYDCEFTTLDFNVILEEKFSSVHYKTERKILEMSATVQVRLTSKKKT